MHYITGTSLVVRRHANIWDKQFTLNTPYTLFNITPQNGKLKYFFRGSSGVAEIVFESSRQADYFISQHKKETIPDYESIYQKNTAL
jgi:hypothetical protein